MPWPVSRIAPKPIRRTTRSPPSVIEPAAAAGSSLGIGLPFSAVRPGQRARRRRGEPRPRRCRSSPGIASPSSPTAWTRRRSPPAPPGAASGKASTSRCASPCGRLHRREEQPVVSLPSGALLPVLLHLQHPQQARRDHGARLPRPGAVEHRVQRIAVLGLRRGDESPVERVVQPERQRTAHRDVPQLGIELQLHPRARGRLHHHQHTFGVPHRQTDQVFHAMVPDAMRFDTLAIHAGQEPDPTTGAIMTPVYLTSTYVQAGPGEHKGYEYSRTRNPTRTALEGCLAALEGARFGAAFASGCAATDTLDAPARRRRPRRLLRRRLRRHVPALRQGLQAPGPHLHLRRPLEARNARGGDHPEDPDGLGRDAHQPHAEAGGPRAGGGDLPRAEDGLGLRQHLPLPLLPAPAGARHRRGRALHHQVHQRPQRHRRRLRRHQQRGARAADLLPAERGRRRPRPDGQLPRAARREDARTCAWTATSRTR